jgi:multiple antibiotic resistance protein
MIHFHETLIYTFLSVFSMVNPVAMSSVFLAITKDQSAAVRKELAYRVAIYGTILLIAVLFFGDYVLNFFGISLPFVQIAGGLVVCFSALEMLNTKPKISSDEEEEASQSTDNVFFPLTMPITAGPGAIAITLTVANSFQETSHLTALLNYIAAVLGIIIVFVCVAIFYRFSDVVFARLGKTGTNAVTKISAVILLAIGVKIMWQGISALVLSLMGHT